MGEITVELQIVADSSYTAQVSDDVPISEMMEQIMGWAAKERPDLDTSEASLVIGRLMDANLTLTELGMKDNEALLIICTYDVRVRLHLIHRENDNIRFTLGPENAPAGVGRPLEKGNWQPLVDVNRASGRAQSISRRQAILTHEQGVWNIELHPKGRTPLFVNDNRLTIGAPVKLQDGDVLSFGSNSRPNLQMVVRLEISE